MTREEAYNRIDAIIAKHEIDDENVTIANSMDYDALRIARKLLEQEPCEDVISRQAAIDAFERCIHELGIEDEPYNYGEMALSAKNVPSVTPQPCGDAISRQAVLDLMADYDLSMGQVVKGIHALPLVTPQQKIGKWIYKKDLKQFFCNKCGYPSLTDDDKYIYSMDLPNFCPHCGAKMVESQESEGKE